MSEILLHHHQALSLSVRVERLHSHIGSSIQEVTARHFAKVSRGVASRLEQFYRLDMQMFGYTPY